MLTIPTLPCPQMKRAVLMLHDETYHSVIAMGRSGVPDDLMKRIGGTLDETPIAQVALEEDRVVEVGVNGRDGDPSNRRLFGKASARASRSARASPLAVGEAPIHSSAPSSIVPRIEGSGSGEVMGRR